MPVFRNDPYPAGNFEITVVGISDDGKAVKDSFSEISGLGVDISVIEYRTGSEDITTRKLPGLKKFSNLVLKRGVIGERYILELAGSGDEWPGHSCRWNHRAARRKTAAGGDLEIPPRLALQMDRAGSGRKQ
jgi:hypothetical protein